MGRMIDGMEFFLIGNEIRCINGDGENQRVDEGKTDLIESILNKVSEHYPKAYEALLECYRKSEPNYGYYRYLMAKRFIKCNFGSLELSKADMEDGSFNFERMLCPMRGECKYEGVICNPQFDSGLSQAELRVMKLLFEGKQIDDIADSLYISPNTAKNHIKSVYSKLGIHEKSEFIRYATKNKLFD